MSSFLEKRIAANKLLMESQDQEIMPEIILRPKDPGGLIASMQASLASAARNDLEQIPRKTLLHMFINCPLEVEYTFKVEHGGGGNYVQAMRQVLSRIRKKAAREKIELEDFKLIELKVETKEDHDEVTLLRSTMMTQKDESAYKDLMALMAEKK